MNLAEWSIRHQVITWVVTVAMTVLGYQSFTSLSRLEDPAFTIKQAKVITPYPGASAAEVGEEVTDLVERAAQKMEQLFYVESHSYRDKSLVTVTMLDKYDLHSLPQVWDELRRRINDVQSQLPPGAGPSLVVDDFGDVYGVYLAITGAGYTPKERYEFTKFLRRELLLVQDVKSIKLFGIPEEVIYVEINHEKMAALGISPQQIFSALGDRNMAVQAGSLLADDYRLAISPTGEYTSEKQFAELLISGPLPNSQQVRLGDVASIFRGLREPASNLLRFDGEPAIGLAIATSPGGNVVTMGEALNARIEALKPQTPLGMTLNVVSMQSDAVTTAINGFTVSLLQAVAIVVVVLLIFMGLKSGLIIGAVLVVTIMGTFIFMQAMDITLERISLGALIIALGMLVDNAIVVTDGIRVRLREGQSVLHAASEVVKQTALPLLGATAIAITAFAAIGTSEDSTGEYTRSLFSVILLSLGLSWFTAVTITPLFCNALMKPASPDGAAGAQDTAYNSLFYRMYRGLLYGAIRFRILTLLLTLLLFATAIYGFGQVKQSFFPDSTRPQFYVDVRYPEDTDIAAVSQRLKAVENTLQQYPGVTHVTTQIGGSSPRFLLTYTPEDAAANFGRLLVDVADYRQLADMTFDIQQQLEQLQPDARVNTRLFVLGPATGGKIQLRISGPDYDQLRRLAEQARQVILSHPNVKGFRNEWGEQTKLLQPVMAEAQARQLGIDREDIAEAMAYASSGVTTGVYRERDELLPIIARAPDAEKKDLYNLGQANVWSPLTRHMLPLGQVISGFDVSFENAHIWRSDRVPMLRLHFDQRTGLSSELLHDLKGDVEKALHADLHQYFQLPAGEPVQHDSSTIPIRYRDRIPVANMPGYFFAWGGENEDSVKGAAAIAESIPVFFGMMVFIVVLLFNSIRKTLVIWLVVPLALIGVTVGLLVFNQPFGFMAMLGFMSLAGMLIKNAIVLVDQIGVELASGKPPVQAVVDSGVSRLIPVAMAALTTILGMIPLLGDAFFVSMAVTIMFGLGFATVLTLVIVPVLYATLFNLRS